MPYPTYDNSKVIKEYTTDVAEKTKNFDSIDKYGVTKHLYYVNIPNQYANFEIKDGKLHNRNEKFTNLSSLFRISAVGVGFIKSINIMMCYPIFGCALPVIVSLSLVRDLYILLTVNNKASDSAREIEVIIDRNIFKKTL